MGTVEERHEELRALKGKSLPHVDAELWQDSISVGAVDLVLFVAHVVEELDLPH